MALPVFKHGRVIATGILKGADRHPRFRSLIPQSNDRITTTMQVQLRSYGHATDVETQPLKGGDKAAVSMGKVLFFGVALGGLIYEVERSARSSGRREAIEVVSDEVEEEVNRMMETQEEIQKELELLGHKSAEIKLKAWIQEANPKLSDV